MGDVRLAVLVSGSGTILESLFEHRLSISVVIADRPCRALEVAAAHGVDAILVDRALYGGFSKSFDKELFTRDLCSVLRQHHIDLVAMAGFGTITAASIYDEFGDRILNTHPSLLPAFKGWHAVRDALAAGVSTTGCTVHVSHLELDAGPVLAQEVVPILDGDDESALHERIKAVERQLYPRVIVACLRALGRGEPVTSIQLN